MRQYYQTHKQPSTHQQKLKDKYGLTLEDYDNLLRLQNGVCAICKKPETRIQRGRITKLCVDHNHITGKNRELLCNSCNTGLGKFKDDLLILESAVDYLKKHLREI